MDTTLIQPVIRRALGESWDTLHTAVRRHYNLPCGELQEIKLHGRMEMDHCTAVKPLLIIGRLFGALPASRGHDVEVTVHNHGDARSLHFYRCFFFPGKSPLVFKSRMQHLANNEIVEFVRFGMGITMRLTVVEGRLRYTGNGYLWRLGPLKLRISDWLLLGKAVIEEFGIDDNTIGLSFDIHHPLWGKTFSYRGHFTLPAEPGSMVKSCVRPDRAAEHPSD